MTRFMIPVTILLILSSVIIAENSCRFETDRGVIDLTSIGRDAGQAAFTDMMPSVGSQYST